MDFIELINKRYSVRAYKSGPVEDEKLSIILNAARMAPTAANRQPFQVLVLHTNDKRDSLLSIYKREWFVQAPLVLCICGLKDQAWIRRDNKTYLDVDAAIVMDHIILAATELGLGTCYIADFDVENARKVLNVPPDIEPILFTPVGYPNDHPKEKVRKNIEELVRYENW